MLKCEYLRTKNTPFLGFSRILEHGSLPLALIHNSKGNVTNNIAYRETCHVPSRMGGIGGGLGALNLIVSPLMKIERQPCTGINGRKSWAQTITIIIVLACKRPPFS